MNSGYAVFLVNLLQDVNVLRPLVFMAAMDLRLSVLVLVTPLFRNRDASGTWQQELEQIAAESGAMLVYYSDELEVHALLAGKRGVMVAGSESSLSAHKPVHELLRATSPGFLRITLQHGFECVGFRQSRDQDLAHGKSITFNADVICGWCAPELLNSVAATQRPKLRITGPTSVLQVVADDAGRQPAGMGLVCENMHSPRLNVAGNFKIDFLEIFAEFCQELGQRGQQVCLRPHPGGQYTLKNNVAMAANVVVNNKPIYKVDLSRYAYGISAPSSILIDMVLAGIPTAVWQDAGSVMDLGNYEGLTRISTINDWLAFAQDAVANPQKFRDSQQRYLARQQMVTDPLEVYSRYAALLTAAPGSMLRHAANPVVRARQRILYVANSFIPTLQLSFVKPLAQLVEAGELVFDLITEDHLKPMIWQSQGYESPLEWLSQRFRIFDPTVVIFCRYSGGYADYMLQLTRECGVPAIYHIDDDLLNIPIDIGYSKYKSHNHRERLASVRHLLDNADLVYCSTLKLTARLHQLAVKAPVVSGDIYCSGQVITPAVNRKITKIGYMGIGHEENLKSVLPALIRFLLKYPEISFEFMGTIPVPEDFKQFGDRIGFAPKIDDYSEFMQKFAEFQWDIGICPLTPIAFNLLKANTKWVEYTSAGVAVVASRGTVYDSCCDDGCGMLAVTEDEWFFALDSLINPDFRYQQVVRAQHKLKTAYSIGRLRDQVLDMLALAERFELQKMADVKILPENFAVAERIIFVCNAMLPTLQLSFLKPLAGNISAGAIQIDVISAEEIKRGSWNADQKFTSRAEWITYRFKSLVPTIVVFCRYSGPYSDLMMRLAHKVNASTIFHIDDDLLNIPEAIGQEKFKTHNRPERLDAVRFLLNTVDLVYCSTLKLKQRLLDLGVTAPVQAGEIYCPGQVLVPAELRPVRKVGYMASADHAHNFRHVMTAIQRYLRAHTEVTFEFFGSIPIPEELLEFGSRISFAPKVDNYEEFLQTFAKCGWDIGICPLAPIHFNLLKANTKWVEYSSLGIAVVASKGTVYDDCCGDGCGMLAETEEEWFLSLVQLTADAQARYQQVKQAQQKLCDHYSTSQLRRQVLDVFALARHCRLETQAVQPQPGGSEAASGSVRTNQ